MGWGGGMDWVNAKSCCWTVACWEFGWPVSEYQTSVVTSNVWKVSGKQRRMSGRMSGTHSGHGS